MASMEERMVSVEATLPHLATKADVANLKADIKDLEVRLTRFIYAVGVGILISIGLGCFRPGGADVMLLGNHRQRIWLAAARASNHISK